MSALDPYDLAIRTYTAIWPRYERAGLSGFTEPERVVFLAWQFASEVNNGGFRQFLTNPSGKHAADTPAALEAVGMSQAALLLNRALATGGPPWLPCTRHLDALTDEFFASPEDPYEQIAQYVRRYSEELPDPVNTD